MAITIVKNPSSLKMTFYCGKNNEGKNIIRSKTFSSLRADAAHEDVYEVGASIASLQKNNLIDILKLDNTIISE